MGSAREQAAAQEGAEGLAGVGFLLALTEALGEPSTGPLTAFHEQPVRVSPGLDTRDVEAATGALIGV